MKRIILSLLLAAAAMTALTAQNLPKVFFTKNITPEALLQIYDSLGVEAHGRVAVKLSTGEPGGHNFLDPQLIAPLVKQLRANIVECNTTYAGRRDKTADHLVAATEHGFTAIAPVDIMDAGGEATLTVKNGRQLKENYVGARLPDYDFMLVLSHFKGHGMGGFGGALKNISIGIGSAQGKAWIHTAGKTRTDPWNNLPPQDDFLEAMAEAASSVTDLFGERIVYISVANNLSVDCDCSSNPAAPQMGDIGIFASLDPVALDQACVDAVYASRDEGKTHLIERMESRHGIHTIEHAAALGVGSRQYKLVEF
ncbi:MAG: DUF362 domain-containing protein [Prevotellaceae bacterium]|nr:DUF362 domain-containing protein [Prevotellaceae bacterium]